MCFLFRLSPISERARRLGPFNVCVFLFRKLSQAMIIFSVDLASKLNNNIRSEREKKAEHEEKWWAKRSLQESALIFKGLFVRSVTLLSNLLRELRTCQRQESERQGERKFLNLHLFLEPWLYLWKRALFFNRQPKSRGRRKYSNIRYCSFRFRSESN